MEFFNQKKRKNIFDKYVNEVNSLDIDAEPRKMFILF